jgi:hypothetical protein
MTVTSNIPFRSAREIAKTTMIALVNYAAGSVIYMMWYLVVKVSVQRIVTTVMTSKIQHLQQVNQQHLFFYQISHQLDSVIFLVPSHPTFPVFHPQPHLHPLYRQARCHAIKPGNSLSDALLPSLMLVR